MSPYEANAIAQLTILARLREADQRRLAHELRQEPPATEHATARTPRRRSHRWHLIPSRHAYS